MREKRLQALLPLVVLACGGALWLVGAPRRQPRIEVSSALPERVRDTSARILAEVPPDAAGQPPGDEAPRPERPEPGIHGRVTTIRRDGSPERAAAFVRVEAFHVTRRVLEGFDPGYERWEEGPRYLGGESVLDLEPDGMRYGMQADGDGRFRFLGLSPGWWVVRVTRRALLEWQGAIHRTWIRDWLRSTERVGEIVHLRSDEDVLPVALRLCVPRPEEESIEGVVVDGAGRPVSGAFVVPFRPGREELFGELTDGDGSFRVGPLDEGTWRLVAMPGPEHDLLPSDPLTAALGQDLQLVLRPAALLSGTGVDAQTVPVPLARAFAMSVDGRAFGRGSTEGSGFEIRRLARGTYDVYVQGLGDRAALLRGVSLLEAQRKTHLFVPLERAALLRIEVSEGQDGALFGIALPGRAPFLLERAQKGSNTVPLPPGDYELATYEVHLPGQLERLTAQPFSLRHGEPLTLELP